MKKLLAVGILAAVAAAAPVSAVAGRDHLDAARAGQFKIDLDTLEGRRDAATGGRVTIDLDTMEGRRDAATGGR